MWTPTTRKIGEDVDSTYWGIPDLHIKAECHMDDGTVKAIIEFYACLRSSDIWRKKGRSKGQK